MKPFPYPKPQQGRQPQQGRRPQNLKKIPPKEFFMLRLKDNMPASSSKGRNVECLQELTLAISCLKSYGFNEESCQNEIQNMKKCFNESFSATLKGGKNKSLTGEDQRKLLKRFPNI